MSAQRGSDSEVSPGLKLNTNHAAQKPETRWTVPQAIP